jgi:hypothetical protein
LGEGAESNRKQEGKQEDFFHGRKIGFLTQENGYATFPTLISHANNIVIAYCMGDNKNSRIAVQVVAGK